MVFMRLIHNASPYMWTPSVGETKSYIKQATYGNSIKAIHTTYEMICQWSYIFCMWGMLWLGEWLGERGRVSTRGFHLSVQGSSFTSLTPLPIRCDRLRSLWFTHQISNWYSILSVVTVVYSLLSYMLLFPTPWLHNFVCFQMHHKMLH